MGDIDNFYVYVGICSKGLGKLISYIGISIEVWARVGENIGQFCNIQILLRETMGF